jgi:hypothetical protein
MVTVMVTQPAYLRNLKEYARKRLTDLETEGPELIANYSTESDRGAIILAATNLEDLLEDKITEKLPGLIGNETARKKIFEHDGLISSFSKKIEMAYAMGIIDADYKKKIDLAREIRNACAHCRFPLSLKQKQLLGACKAFIHETWDQLKDHEPGTIRIAFVVTCTFIAHYIVSGEKIEGSEAQIRHNGKLRAAAAKA